MGFWRWVAGCGYLKDYEVSILDVAHCHARNVLRRPLTDRERERVDFVVSAKSMTARNAMDVIAAVEDEVDSW